MSKKKEAYVKSGDREGVHGRQVFLFVILHDGHLLPGLSNTEEFAKTHPKRVSPIFPTTADTKGKDF